MSFLTPLSAIVAGAVAIPALLLLYFLRLRRRTVDVSSTLLWRQTIHDLQANAPFQKLRRSLLLLLQLLLLACVLLAMARPTWQRDARQGARLVLLIDHSGSMNATDVGEGTRLDAAMRRARALIDDAAAGVMVVSFAEHPVVRQTFSTDTQALREAIDGIGPTDLRSRLREALALIDAFARDAQAEDAPPLRVVVLSDGRLHDRGELRLPGGRVAYVGVGFSELKHVRNVGIVSLAARRDPRDPQRMQVYSRIANFGGEPVETTVTVEANGRTLQVQKLSLPARADRDADPPTAALPIDLAVTEPTLLRVRVDGDDALAADNQAAVQLLPQRGLRVMLVTEGNAFLARAIRSMRLVAVEHLNVMHPAAYDGLYAPPQPRTFRNDDRGYDLLVFDGAAPKRTPLVNSLTFGPPPPIRGVTAVQPFDREHTQPIVTWQRDHPLLAHVTFDNVIVRNPSRLELPDDATVLAATPIGPVMALLEANGAQHLLTAFRSLDSDWMLQVSFVIFLSNTLQQLGADDAAEGGVSYSPGAIVELPGSVGDAVTFSGPTSVSASRTEANLPLTLPSLDRAGVYRADLPPPWNTLPVNLTDATESDIAAAPSLRVLSPEGDAEVAAGEVRGELWRWFLLAAVGVLMLEWLVYVRRNDLRA